MGVMASGGSGSMISTLVAALRSLNWLRALTRYSVRLRLCFSTVHSTHISGLTCWLSRYVLQGRRTPLVAPSMLAELADSRTCRNDGLCTWTKGAVMGPQFFWWHT